MRRGRAAESCLPEDRALVLAERTNEPVLVVVAHFCAAHTDFYLGEFASSLQHAEKARALAEPRSEPWARRWHMAALWQTARSLWFLGYPERAVARSAEASDQARRNFDPYTSAITTGVLSELHAYGGQNEQMKQQLQAHLALNARYGFAPVVPGRAKILEGWWQVERGELQPGIGMIREGIELNSAGNNALNCAFYSALLTRAYARSGQLDEALGVLDRAFARIEQSGERFYEAELYRLRGELLNSSNADPPSIKACLYKALEVARSQNAKSLELRATTSLTRLLAKHGKRGEARTMLAEIYNSFTEGFDTADLKDAKTLLEELSG